MKALLLAALAAAGLSGCYAEGAPYGAYNAGYYTQPGYGYATGGAVYTNGYATPVYGGPVYGAGRVYGGPVYGGAGYGGGYRPAPAYRPGAVYVSAPGGYHGAPAYRAAPAYHVGARGFRR